MLAGLLSAWQLTTAGSTSLLIASFTDTVRGMWVLLQQAELWDALLESNKAVAIGFPLSVVTAVPCGLVMARWQRFGKAMTPHMVVLLAVPIAPLVPVLIIALGLGLAPRVLVVVLFSWVYIVLNVRTGVRTVDQDLIDMGRAYGCSERQIWRRILWPGAMPAIMAGLRIGAARSIEGMVVAELIMVASGLGGLVLRFRGRFQADMVFATVGVIIVEALLVVLVMRAIEKRVLHWADSSGA